MDARAELELLWLGGDSKGPLKEAFLSLHDSEKVRNEFPRHET